MPYPMRAAALLAPLLLSAITLSACSERSHATEVVAAASAARHEEHAAPVAFDAGAEVALDASAPDASADAGPEPEGPCPAGMALVGRFCIDRYEAHLVARGFDGGFTEIPHNQRPPASARFEARSSPGVMPQGYINRVEAAAACKNASKRLCTMREWRRACEGKRGLTFPYGMRFLAGRCNMNKPHLLALRYGSDARRWKYDDNFNDPALDVEPGFLAKAGEHEGCAAAEGVYDLVGNLHEWVSDTVDEAFMERFEVEAVERRSQPWNEGNGVFMGGFFSTAEQLGPGCSYTTVAHEPTYHDYSIGFRCCAAADVPVPPARKAPKGRPR